MGITGFGKPGGPFDVKKDAQGNVVFSSLARFSDSDSGTAAPSLNATVSTTATGETWYFVKMSLTATNRNAVKGGTITFNGTTLTTTPTLTTAETLSTTTSGTFTSPSFAGIGKFFTTTTTTVNPQTSAYLNTSGTLITNTTITGTNSVVAAKVNGGMTFGLAAATVYLRVNKNTLTATSTSGPTAISGVTTGTFTNPVVTISVHANEADTATIRSTTQRLGSGLGGSIELDARRPLYERV